MEKAIITSCSNKFFPAAINLIGSIKSNYPDHPTIFVYTIDLFEVFKKALEKIDNVKVVEMPHFCPFWRKCFTWKTYIFKNPPARLNFYIDSGFQVEAPLQEVFDQIERDDFLAVSQNNPLEIITPKEYKAIFDIDEKYYKDTYITAGIFGFKKNSKISPVLGELYERALEGLCLGFSPVEKWRNKGKDKNEFVRNCELFRFDTSVLSLLMRKHFGEFVLSDQTKYELGTKHENTTQLILNARLKYIEKRNKNLIKMHTKKSFMTYLLQGYINLFIFLKTLKHAKN